MPVQFDFPATGSFREYETVYRSHSQKYGYYTHLVRVGDYLFRSYKKEGNAGYGIHIYRGTELIGNVVTDSPLEIIGRHDDWFYGILPADMDNESFKILKFML